MRDDMFDIGIGPIPEIDESLIDTVLSIMIDHWTEAMYTDTGYFAVNLHDEEVNALSDQACAWCAVGYMRVVLARTTPLMLMDTYENVIVRGIEDWMPYIKAELTIYSDTHGHAATIAMLQEYQASRVKVPDVMA